MHSLYGSLKVLSHLVMQMAGFGKSEPFRCFKLCGAQCVVLYYLA